MGKLRVRYFGALQKGQHLGKNPGLSDGRTADHDGIAAGFLLHIDGVFRIDDVTVSDHRDGNTLFDGGYQGRFL